MIRSQPSTGSPQAVEGRFGWVRSALLVLAALALLFVLGRWGGQYVPRFAAWIGGLGPLGPLFFIAGYIVATVLGIPGSLLTLAAGAIFGLWAGVAYVFVGATLGASAAFLVSRYVARSAIERRVSRNPRFQAIDRAISDDGRRIVFLLRLSPVFPFTLLNYALGLSQVSFVDFVVASIGMLPGTVLFVYYGKLAGDVAAVAGGVAPARGAGYYALLGLGLVATILVTAVITRSARRALQASTMHGGTE
ncbi:MAG TPA: TVP38/TMEM64 family protein [Gemmatimonas sp.]|nr:TVP38/TMEM64 family protein [Gemmatimonas sp.]